MSLETTFIVCSVAFGVFVTVILTLFKVQKRQIGILLLLSGMLFSLVYVYGLSSYQLQRNLKAFESKHQVEQCGKYLDTVFVQDLLHTAHPFYRFQDPQGQIIEFNGEALTQHYYPLLVQLGAKETVCYAYAQDVQDWAGRYYLTYLKRDNISQPSKHPDFSLN